MHPRAAREISVPAAGKSVGTFDKLSLAAHHEAGHAVIGFSLGVEVGEVTIERDSTADEWDGKANVVPKKSEDIARIAFAGPLAEIKFHGHVCLGYPPGVGATLDPRSVPQIVEAFTNIANEPRMNPAQLNCTLVVGEMKMDFPVRLHACDDDAHKACRAGADLHRESMWALEMVNDSPVWDKITRLANAIVRSNERTILRKGVSELIATSLLSNGR